MLSQEEIERKVESVMSQAKSIGSTGIPQLRGYQLPQKAGATTQPQGEAVAGVERLKYNNAGNVYNDTIQGQPIDQTPMQKLSVAPVGIPSETKTNDTTANIELPLGAGGALMRGSDVPEGVYRGIRNKQTIDNVGNVIRGGFDRANTAIAENLPQPIVGPEDTAPMRETTFDNDGYAYIGAGREGNGLRRGEVQIGNSAPQQASRYIGDTDNELTSPANVEARRVERERRFNDPNAVRMRKDIVEGAGVQRATQAQRDQLAKQTAVQGKTKEAIQRDVDTGKAEVRRDKAIEDRATQQGINRDFAANESQKAIEDRATQQGINRDFAANESQKAIEDRATQQGINRDFAANESQKVIDGKAEVQRLENKGIEIKARNDAKIAESNAEVAKLEAELKRTETKEAARELVKAKKDAAKIKADALVTAEEIKSDRDVAERALDRAAEKTAPGDEVITRSSDGETVTRAKASTMNKMNKVKAKVIYNKSVVDYAYDFESGTSHAYGWNKKAKQAKDKAFLGTYPDLTEADEPYNFVDANYQKYRDATPKGNVTDAMIRQYVYELAVNRLPE
jgi:hypothetical protein